MKQELRDRCGTFGILDESLELGMQERWPCSDHRKLNVNSLGGSTFLSY